MLSPSNDNHLALHHQPTLNPTGLLTYTPAADANGTATVTVTAQDDGGTANGGHDTTVGHVHDHRDPVQRRAGVHDVGKRDRARERRPAIAAPWVSSKSPGPADEAAQHDHVHSTATTTPRSSPPEHSRVAADGTLSFTPRR